MLRVCLRPRVRLTSKAQSPSGDRLECFQNGGQRPSRPQSHGEHQFSSTLFLLSSLFLPRMLLTFPLPPLGPHYCLQSGPHWAPSMLWVSLHRVSPHLEEDAVQPEDPWHQGQACAVPSSFVPLRRTRVLLAWREELGTDMRNLSLHISGYKELL